MYPLDTYELEEIKNALTTCLDSNQIIPSDSLYGALIVRYNLTSEHCVLVVRCALLVAMLI